jgi:hypothetical protein
MEFRPAFRNLLSSATVLRSMIGRRGPDGSWRWQAPPPRATKPPVGGGLPPWGVFVALAAFAMAGVGGAIALNSGGGGLPNVQQVVTPTPEPASPTESPVARTPAPTAPATTPAPTEAPATPAPASPAPTAVVLNVGQGGGAPQQPRPHQTNAPAHPVSTPAPTQAPVKPPAPRPGEPPAPTPGAVPNKCLHSSAPLHASDSAKDNANDNSAIFCIFEADRIEIQESRRYPRPVRRRDDEENDWD